MGSCYAAQQAVDDVVLLQFEQSEESLAANGGLVHRSPFGGREMPINHIGYTRDFVYFFRAQDEIIAMGRGVRR